MEEIKRILNPPFASNEGDNYYDSLSGRLSSYINYLHISAFDKVLSSDDYQRFTDIRKKILHVLQQYLSGHSGEAYKEFSYMSCNNICQDIQGKLTRNSKILWILSHLIGRKWDTQ